MKIICIMTDPFPKGFGAVPFVNNFCSGFLNRQAEVFLISYAPRENSAEYTEYKYNNINVTYTAVSGSSSFFSMFFSALKTVWTVWRMTSSMKIDTVYFFTYGIYEIIVKLLISPFVKSVVFHGEYPNAGRAIQGWKKKLISSIDIKLTDRFMYGGIFSSQHLIDYYKKYIPSEAKMIEVPLLIDCGRFMNFTQREDQNYISYCGDFGGNKDGVPDLLKAFSLIAKEFPEIKLKLIGSSSNLADVERLKDFVKENELTERVVFTGAVSHSEMPAHLGNSRILALARPNNRQAHGGFPGKLGEYLATGVPVVVTRVGVIDQYFEDETHLFFAEPDNPEMFAERLRYVLNNPEKASIVARNGQKSACEQFDYNIQIARILKEISPGKE